MLGASFLKQFKSLNQASSSLLVFLYLSRLGLFISVPYMAFYLAYLHYPPMEIGIVVGAQPIAYALWSLCGGFLGDKFGKKNTMVLAYIGMGLGSLGFGIVHTATDYFLFNIILGLTRANFDASMPAYFVDLIPENSQRFMFNLRFLIINLAGATGPLIGVYFANHHSTAVYFYSAFIYFICSVVMQWLLPSDRRQQLDSNKEHTINLHTTLQAFKNDKALLLLVLGTALYFIVYVQLEAPFAQVLLRRNPTDATWLFGLMWIINTLMIVLLQMPLAAWTKDLSLKTLTYGGVLLISFSFIGLALTANIGIFVLCILILTLGEMLLSPISNIIVANIAPPNLRSAYFGALSFGFLGMGLGPMIGGLLLQYGNSEILFLGMAIVTWLIVFCYQHPLNVSNKQAISISPVIEEEPLS